MQWWNDLWLNEGFAKFMEFMSVDITHPELQVVRIYSVSVGGVNIWNSKECYCNFDTSNTSENVQSKSKTSEPSLQDTGRSPLLCWKHLCEKKNLNLCRHPKERFTVSYVSRIFQIEYLKAMLILPNFSSFQKLITIYSVMEGKHADSYYYTVTTTSSKHDIIFKYRVML